MTDLPTKSDLTSGTTTEADFQSAIGAVYDYLSELVTGASPETNDIVLGSITPSSTFIIVNTESDTSADDLANVLNTNIGSKVIFMRSESSSRAVTIKHLAGGTGQLYTNTQADTVLDNTHKMIAFYYNTTSSRWEELWRNWGILTPTAGDIAAVKASLSLGTAANVNTGTSSGQVPLNSDLGALAYLAVVNNTNLLSDSIVTNAKIAAATIAINKLANSTAGAIVGFNASGVATVIAPGTSGHVLTSNGAGNAPTYQAPSLPSNNCVLLGDVSLAGSGQAITWTSRTDIKTIMIELTDVYGSPGDIALYLWRNGSQYSGTSYSTRRIWVNGTSSGNLTGTVTETFYSNFVLTQSNSNSFINGNLFIAGCDTGGNYPSLVGSLSSRNTGKIEDIRGQLQVTGAIINGVTVAAGASFTGGRMRIWGFV